MSQYYTHLLIARPKDFVPTGGQVQEFLSSMVKERVVPTLEEILLLIPSTRTRTGVNPFTGEKVVLSMKDRVEISEIDEISKPVANLPDYEIHVAGAGRPALPPLPVKIDGDYYVTVRCRVSPTTRSTSYISDWDKTAAPVSFIGTPCSSDSTMGYFSDPNDGPALEIPGAGCARFWIEIELGRNMYPVIKNHNLNILNSNIVAIAQQIFAIPFVQGYQWG